MNEEGRPTSGEKKAGGGVWLCCVWLHQLIIFYALHCLDEALYLSGKLAVASWSYSCFSKGRGRPECNTVIFHSEPLPSPPKSPGHFEAVLKADGHGLKSCQVSRQSVFSISKSQHFPGSYAP